MADTITPEQYAEQKPVLTITHNNKNGYLVFFDIKHPLAAHESGMVYLNRHIMSLILNRWLTDDEVVAFADGDPSNCREKNLILTDRSGLGKMRDQNIWKTCEHCGKLFHVSASHYDRRETCSNECRAILDRKAERPSADILKKLLWGAPAIEIASHYGVSNKAIEKWAKKCGVTRPPAGYWTTHTKTPVEKILAGA